MASIAIMLGGAVLNATTFIGGSYFAKYLWVYDGNVNEKELKASKKIRTSLGARADKVFEIDEEEIARRKERIAELQDQLEKTAEKKYDRGTKPNY